VLLEFDVQVDVDGATVPDRELPGVLDTAAVAEAMDVLGDINARICAHFALEERLMRERGYDENREHKADHDRLLDDLRERRRLIDEYDGATPTHGGRGPPGGG